MMAGVRLAAAAGRFYPDNATRLSAMVAEFLKDAPPGEPQDELIGGLVPHAGYPYSGPVAAHTFRHLEGKEFGTVILLGAAHFVRASGLVLDDHAAYHTPLGDIPVDQGLVQALITRWIGAVFIEYFRNEMQQPIGGLTSLARREWERLTTAEQLRQLVQAARTRLSESSQDSRD